MEWQVRNLKCECLETHAEMVRSFWSWPTLAVCSDQPADQGSRLMDKSSDKAAFIGAEDRQERAWGHKDICHLDCFPRGHAALGGSAKGGRMSPTCGIGEAVQHQASFPCPLTARLERSTHTIGSSRHPAEYTGSY